MLNSFSTTISVALFPTPTHWYILYNTKWIFCMVGVIKLTCRVFKKLKKLFEKKIIKRITTHKHSLTNWCLTNNSFFLFLYFYISIPNKPVKTGYKSNTFQKESGHSSYIFATKFVYFMNVAETHYPWPIICAN